ncbi:MAG: SPOR domain-containing protein [Woeseiaceae bacterium]
MMERALKERIIGATVLVVFVVLVVPIFLDGPPTDGETVSERVLLPGQSDQETQTVVLERDRTVPVPSNTTDDAGQAEPAATPQSAPPEEQPEPVVIRRPEPSTIPPKPAPEPAREETAVEPQPAEENAAAAPEPTSTTGMWAVQLGSFSNKENAERLAADLRKQGYAAFLSRLETDNGILHRVRIGPQENRDAAEAVAARLAKADHDGQVVPHP